MRALVGVLLVSVGCTSLSGLSGAGDPPASDGGTGDGASPVTSPEAGTTEAGTAMSGCAGSTAFFCADFDQGAPELGWSEKSVDDGGTLSLDETTSTSAPRSLVADRAWLRRAVPASAPRVRMGFAFNGGCFGGGPADQVVVANLRCTASGAGQAGGTLGGALLRLDSSGGATLTAAYAGLNIQQSDVPIPLNAAGWRNVSADVTWGNPGHVKVVVDGIVAADQPIPVGCTGTVAIDAIVGSAPSANSPSCSVHFDDVLVETAF